MSRILALHNSHNASVCEINNQEIVYFQEAERIDRIKKSPNYRVLLDKYKNQKFDKIIFINAQYSYNFPEELAIKVVKTILKKSNIISLEFIYEKEHHFYHACCAFFNSGFEKSYALIFDGSGTTDDEGNYEIGSLYYFYKNKYKKIFKLFSSNHEDYIKGKDIYMNTFSLGGMFTFVKTLLNYKEEGAVMALACYTNEFVDQEINRKFFYKKNNHFKSSQPNIYNWAIEHHSKKPEAICNSVQTELETIVIEYIKNIIKNKKRNLCVSGGCFQNTVLNSKILDTCPDLYVDPFADDSGISMGAALWHSNKNKFKKQKIKSLQLGDSPNYNILKKDLNKGINVSLKDVANLLSNKKIIAIYQGKNELGKRALGNRSFLYDPRDSFAKEKINLLKGREWFRPTAGVIMQEYAEEWFDLKTKQETPFMSYVFQVKKKTIPGITHVDNSCRIQTVTKSQNFYLYNLLNEFNKITGVPILLNTSFNLAGQPLVNLVEDAIQLVTKKQCFFDYVFLPELGKLYDRNSFYDN